MGSGGLNATGEGSGGGDGPSGKRRKVKDGAPEVKRMRAAYEKREKRRVGF